MNRLQRLVARAVTTGTALAAPLTAFAQLSGSPSFAGTAQGDLISAVTTIVNIFLILAGLVASIFLIIGGVQYITSRGDEDAAAKAKDTILYAVIGLVVIGLAAAIVNFVVGAIGSA